MNLQELRREHLKQPMLRVQIGEQVINMLPKVFSSGSLGWHGQAKIEIQDTRCQLNLVCTVIGSKPSVGPTPPVGVPPQVETLTRTVHPITASPEALEGPQSHSDALASPNGKKRPSKRS